MLLAASQDIGQLVILAIVFIGWVLKEVFEAQKRRRMRSPEPRPVPSETPKAQRRREPREDVVYGTRPLPHLPSGGTKPAPERERPAPQTRSRRRAAPASRIVTRTGTVVEGGRSVTTLVETHTTTRATESTTSKRRGRAMHRLRIEQFPGAMRDKARIAVLWSEVLGPCRALRGPHRAPTFERVRRG